MNTSFALSGAMAMALQSKILHLKNDMPYGRVVALRVCVGIAYSVNTVKPSQ